MIDANHLDMFNTDIGFEAIDGKAIGSLVRGSFLAQLRVIGAQGGNHRLEYCRLRVHIIGIGDNDELGIPASTEALLDQGDGLAVGALGGHSRIRR